MMNTFAAHTRSTYIHVAHSLFAGSPGVQPQSIMHAVAFYDSELKSWTEWQIHIVSIMCTHTGKTFQGTSLLLDNSCVAVRAHHY